MSASAPKLPHSVLPIAPLQWQALVRVSLFSGSFFVFSLFYCYAYALVVPGSFSSNFHSALSCVSRDWLAWLLLTPLLSYVIFKKDLTTRTGSTSAIALIVISTVLLGGARMLSEYWSGGDQLLHVLMFYVPRYLVITALMVTLGLMWIFKGCADTNARRCQQLQQALINLQSPEPESEPFLVYKGNARKLIRPQDIQSVHASGNYLELETANDRYLMRNTMKNIEQQLRAVGFVRIHRSHLVNMRTIDKVCCTKFEVHLNGGKVLKIGKKYLQELPHFQAPPISCESGNPLKRKS